MPVPPSASSSAERRSGRARVTSSEGFVAAQQGAKASGGSRFCAAAGAHFGDQIRVPGDVDEKRTSRAAGSVFASAKRACSASTYCNQSRIAVVGATAIIEGMKPLLQIRNHHVPACGDAPAVNDDDPNVYVDYFAGPFGDQ
jgi:hypothetical protein